MIIAWHGDAALREEVLARLWEHRKADTIVQKLYQQYDRTSAMRYRGCAIGCILPLQGTWFGPRPYVVDTPANGWHSRVEELYGIPRDVGRLIDRIFESLPAGEAGDFAVAAMEAVPVGADLSLVTSRMMLDLLADDKHGVWRCTTKRSRQRAAIDTVAGLYRRRLAGDEPSAEEWKNAYGGAVDAAATDATAACAVAASTGAAHAGYAIDNAAACSAVDAANDAAAGNARHWMADQLIQHLTDAPVPPSPPNPLNTTTPPS